ncbi:hypothetical protein TSAR_012377 [Trichomalopsis sarcophagae]|uniref:Transmembrane protein n=1 Tax=Trichomalopsis sarcophagae TaxID=543379 RepID=A0A232EMB8_9HYME|nr:hypothetical protein TSAR_012377 [Trichomalopsis sarcophagae]
MHETEERMNHNGHHQHHQHHLRSASSSTSRHSSSSSASSNGKGQHHNHSSSGSRMACEKASRKLRATLLKAARLGVSSSEIASLPAAKKIVSQRDHDWKLAVLLLLMFGGGVIVALVCTTSRGCSKLEDIVSRIPSFFPFLYSAGRTNEGH